MIPPDSGELRRPQDKREAPPHFALCAHQRGREHVTVLEVVLFYNHAESEIPSSRVSYGRVSRFMTRVHPQVVKLSEQKLRDLIPHLSHLVRVLTSKSNFDLSLEPVEFHVHQLPP